MAQIDDLPPLREVVAAHGLSARKALGQNFLFDLNLTSRIARSAGKLDDIHVLEIGPGPGGLTRALLAAGARQVTAIEMDERCLAPLSEISMAYPERLRVIHGDALATDMAGITNGERCCIIANLPYNVASPLIIGWLQSEPWPPWFQSITVMVQREYAERLVATTAQRSDYGRLAVLTALRAEARILFNVPPSAFFPPPKVMSTIVQLIPRNDAEHFSMPLLEKLTAAAFGQRRKMLRQSLKSLGNALELLEAAGIAPERRAEEIPPEGYLRMVRLLEARSA
ncbi:MAG: 16S rRNA (adenine(1518)-N(6)/adenine(1519)-N(6))-dimethyltransferase RsmA [Beijerinckiaceae bacterium]